jgi:spore maturation protein SpmB
MRRFTLGVVLVGVLVAAPSMGAGASPQPRPVCGVCGAELTTPTTSFETSIRDRSDASVQVHSDGSATWYDRTVLVDETVISSLRDDPDPDAVDAFVAEGVDDSTLEGPFHDVSAALDGSTMRVQFTDPDAVMRMPGGSLLVDYLLAGGNERLLVLKGDERGIRGPDEATGRNSAPDASIDGRTATWVGTASSPFHDAPVFTTDAYLSFGDDSMSAGAWTGIAIAQATLPTVVTTLTEIHLLPLFVFALGMLGIGVVGRWLVETSSLPGWRTIALAVFLVGAVGVALYVLGQVGPQGYGHPLVLPLGIPYLSVGGVAYWRESKRVRDLLLAGLLSLCGMGLIVILTLSGEAIPQLEAIQEGLRIAAAGLPLVAMIFYGATAVVDTRARSLAGLLVVLCAFFLTELAYVWPTERPFGIVILVLGSGAVAYTLFGLPLFLLGGIARDERSGNI